MQPVLAGIRVLDFGRYLAGPFCSALLADLGAEVIRVDRPGGSEDRYVMSVSEDGTGALFLQVNRNKKSITLDPSKPSGDEVVRRLVETADVVVANMPGASLRALGLDYESLTAIKSDIILTNATAFGNGGPSSHRVGFDGVGQAMSGAAYLGGTPDQPVKAAVPVVDYGTALCCAFGTLAAIMARQQTGEGQLVEGSLLGTALTMTNAYLIEQALNKCNRKASLNRSQIAGPSDIFKTMDGWIIVQVIGQAMFKRWAKLVKAEELIDDPRFADDEKRGENGEILSARMSEWCAAYTNEQALAVLDEAKIPSGPVLSLQETLDDPHSRAAGFLQAVDYPGLSQPAPVCEFPVRLSKTPGTLRMRPPMVGEHTTEVLGHLGYSDAEIESLKNSNVI